MSDTVPHLAIVQIDTVPEEFLSHFTTIVRTDGLSLLVQSRPSLPYAGIEWYMPTALFVYIAKPYFESFLKEMGKDHYEVLKNGLRACTSELLGQMPLKSHLCQVLTKCQESNLTLCSSPW
jgi:hypothetical protein